MYTIIHIQRKLWYQTPLFSSFLLKSVALAREINLGWHSNNTGVLPLELEHSNVVNIQTAVFLYHVYA